MTYEIILADDQPLIRDCVRKILAEGTDLEIVDEAEDGQALLHLLETRAALPDMVITDISMPKLEGIETTRQIGKLYPKIKVLVLTVHKDEEYAAEAMKAGAAGYLVKDQATEELIPAITKIREGESYISAYLARADSDIPTDPASKKSRTQNGGA